MTATTDQLPKAPTGTDQHPAVVGGPNVQPTFPRGCGRQAGGLLLAELAKRSGVEAAFPIQLVTSLTRRNRLRGNPKTFLTRSYRTHWLSAKRSTA